LNTRRIFFALWPDVRQRDYLRGVINSVANFVEGKPVNRRNWHVTLSFIGTFPEHRLPSLLERAAEIPVEPFRLVFDQLDYWPRPRVAALCASNVPPELQFVVDSLNRVVTDLGLKPENRVYRPHITVARGASRFEAEHLAQPATTEWSSFELMESVSGPRGVTYSPVKQ
jgi:2'-5' RNA ligase